MADNDTLSDGKIVSLDDVGGVLVQRVKLQIGADGAAVDIEPPADGIAAAKIIPAAQMIKNPASGLYYPVRESGEVPDGHNGSGIAPDTPMRWNGLNFDFERSNEQGVLLASATRTAQSNSANKTNWNARGVIVTLNITAASGTGGLIPEIYGVDPAGGGGYQVNQDIAPRTATGIVAIELYPGSSAGVMANIYERVSGALPRTWFVRVLHGDASNYTYSVSYTLIV